MSETEKQREKELAELSARFGLPTISTEGEIRQWCKVGNELIEIPFIEDDSTPTQNP